MMRKNIAPLHSKGLDYLYNYLNNPTTRSEIKLNKKQQIAKGVNSFMSLESTKHSLDKYSNTLKTRTNTSDIEKNKKTELLESYYYKFVENCTQNNILRDIDLFMGQEEIKGLNNEDKNILLLALFVYEDSYNYWGKNLNKWNLLNNRPKTRGFWSDLWDTVTKYAAADGNGAVNGAIGGATVGAIGGAMAGGAGAIPGAASGFVYGGIGGAVQASTAVAMN